MRGSPWLVLRLPDPHLSAVVNCAFVQSSDFCIAEPVRLGLFALEMQGLECSRYNVAAGILFGTPP